jgi:hypothetical protein
VDAVFYLRDALRLFRGKSLPEIQEITFEIGMRGAVRARYHRSRRAFSVGGCW